ncbi:hypothetical protein D3C85_1465360 [compost metagenome]
MEFQRFDAQKAGPDHQEQLTQQQPQQRAGEDGGAADHHIFQKNHQVQLPLGHAVHQQNPELQLA